MLRHRSRIGRVGILAVFAIALVATSAAPPALAKLDDKEWSAAKGRLERAVSANPPDYAEIAGAVREIGPDQSKRAVDLLLKIGIGLDNIQVFDAVREALTGMSEPEALKHMIDSIDHKDWQIRTLLCDCLGKVPGDEATKAIASRLDKKENVPYVVSAAAKSLGKRRDKAGMEPLMDALERFEKSKDVVWIDVKQALTDITGQDFATAQEWRDYWVAVKDTFDPEKDRGEKDTSGTQVRDDEAGKFFKEKIISKRVMFVIDVSGSMREKDPPIDGVGGGVRVDRVKQELIDALKGLKKDVKFNVIAYSSTNKPWKKQIVPADDGAKADAIKFVSGFKADGSTGTEDAMKLAFENIEINTIVLLSDGAPTDKTGQQLAPPGPILEKIKGWNRLRGVKIHTFCFEIFKKTPGAEPLLQFMQDMADQNGGKLTLIK